MNRELINRRYFLNRKLEDPNRYLKARILNTNPAYIRSHGIHLNNGIYYDRTRLARVLKIDYMNVIRWVRDGRLPNGQFVVKKGTRIAYYWRFEEVFGLVHLLSEYYVLYDRYILDSEVGRQLRDDIHDFFEIIYDHREEQGLEKYQPEF